MTIYRYYVRGIKQEVTAERLTYWTHDDRENWFKRRIRPRLEKPSGYQPLRDVEHEPVSWRRRQADDPVEFPTLKTCGLCYFLPAV
jgi:hypothetical protein